MEALNKSLLFSASLTSIGFPAIWIEPILLRLLIYKPRFTVRKSSGLFILPRSIGGYLFGLRIDRTNGWLTGLAHLVRSSAPKSCGFCRSAVLDEPGIWFLVASPDDDVALNCRRSMDKEWGSHSNLPPSFGVDPKKPVSEEDGLLKMGRPTGFEPATP